MAKAGVSTVGTLVGWAVEEEAGVMPADFTIIHRVNSVGGLQTENAKIDSSALEDKKAVYIIGRCEDDGAFPVGFNLTQITAMEWQTIIDEYANRDDEEKRLWFEIWNPNLDDAFYIIVAPPDDVSMPEIGQEELFVATMNMTVKDFIGSMTGIKPMPQMFYLMDENEDYLVDENDDYLLAYLEIEDSI